MIFSCLIDFFDFLSKNIENFFSILLQKESSLNTNKEYFTFLLERYNKKQQPKKQLLSLLKINNNNEEYISPLILGDESENNFNNEYLLKKRERDKKLFEYGEKEEEEENECIFPGEDFYYGNEFYGQLIYKKNKKNKIFGEEVNFNEEDDYIDRIVDCEEDNDLFLQ